jgi:hypothetical protein
MKTKKGNGVVEFVYINPNDFNCPLESKKIDGLINIINDVIKIKRKAVTRKAFELKNIGIYDIQIYHNSRKEKS